MARMVKRCFGLLAVVLVVVSVACVQAQTPILEEPGYKPTLTFDVATIRQAPPPDSNFRVTVNSPTHTSRFEATNLPLKTLLQVAYGFEAPISGAPDWMTNSFYNIQARSDEATDARLAKLSENEVRLEKRNAIRVMLAERLELKTHLETRNSSVYHLVVDKGGVKMMAVPAPPPPADGQPAPPAFAANFQTRGVQHGLELVGSNVTARSLIGFLSSMVEAPILDKTGLTGTYNCKLQFGRDWSSTDPESWPSIFTALQEQLGLRLEAVHEAVPNLVVDHVTKPTEN